MQPVHFISDIGWKGLGRAVSSSDAKWITKAEWEKNPPDHAPFVVLDMGRHTDRVSEFFDTIVPRDVLAANREGRLGIVLDNSREGNAIARDAWAKWYDVIRRLGLDPRLIVFVSQNVRAPGEHARFCNQRGIEEPIGVTCYHWFLKRLIDQRRAPPPPAPVVAEADKRLALCLMYKARPNRIKLALALLKHGLWDRSLVSFGGLDPAAWTEPHRRIDPAAALQRMRDYMHTADLEPYLPELEAKGRVILGAVDPIEADPNNTRAADIIWDVGGPMYERTRFSIVSETEMMNTVHRFTEKSVKPLASRHPMVVFGNPQTLRLLRELGFATFGGLIDEGYDEVTDPNERFDAAFEQVRRLAAMTPCEWERRSRLVADVLDHNAETFFERLPATFERMVERPFLRELAWRAMPRSAGSATPPGA